MLNIPNILTLMRLALIPALVVVYFMPGRWPAVIATAIFVAAALTDLLDGYLARRWEQVSPLGAFLDPVADKLMVAAALIMLVQVHPTIWMVIPAIVIIGREITISALREWMAELGARAQVAVSVMGKFKTAAQMLALTMLIYAEDIWGIPVFTAGFVLLYVAVVLTLWSMILYLQAAWPALSDE